MTDEERPKARMKYVAGFKRIYAVLAACWAGFCKAVGIFLAAAVIVPALGYGFFFKVIPWIIEGFRKK